MHWCHKIHSSGDRGWGCCSWLMVISIRFKKKKKGGEGRKILIIILKWKEKNSNYSKTEHGIDMKCVTSISVNWPDVNITIYSGDINQPLTFSLLLHASRTCYNFSQTASNRSYLRTREGVSMIELSDLVCTSTEEKGRFVFHHVSCCKLCNERTWDWISCLKTILWQEVL